jgi:hypothetical protein
VEREPLDGLERDLLAEEDEKETAERREWSARGTSAAKRRRTRSG